MELQASKGSIAAVQDPQAMDAVYLKGQPPHVPFPSSVMQSISPPLDNLCMNMAKLTRSWHVSLARYLLTPWVELYTLVRGCKDT